MKPTTSLPTAPGDAGNIRSRPLRQTSAELWPASDSAWSQPRPTYYWASSISGASRSGPKSPFTPGVLAGFKVNERGLSVAGSKAVGVLAVGLAYAALAGLGRFAWLALKHRRQSAAMRKNSE